MANKALTAAAAAMVTISAGAAWAQTAADPIEYCREHADGKKARIACLEAAIITLMGERERAAQAPAAGAGEGSAATGTPEDAPVAVAAAEEPADAGPTGLGAEQVERRHERKAEAAGVIAEKASLDAKVVEHATTSLGKAIFFLDNGQIWRQRNSDKTRVRLSKSRNYTVTISEGMISGYRLKINEINRMIVVERIK